MTWFHWLCVFDARKWNIWIFAFAKIFNINAQFIRWRSNSIGHLHSKHVSNCEMCPFSCQTFRFIDPIVCVCVCVSLIQMVFGIETNIDILYWNESHTDCIFISCHVDRRWNAMCTDFHATICICIAFTHTHTHAALYWRYLLMWTATMAFIRIDHVFRCDWYTFQGEEKKPNSPVHLMHYCKLQPTTITDCDVPLVNCIFCTGYIQLLLFIDALRCVRFRIHGNAQWAPPFCGINTLRMNTWCV